MEIEIRNIGPLDLGWVHETLTEHWMGPTVVSRGHLYRADRLPGLIAVLKDARNS